MVLELVVQDQVGNLLVGQIFEVGKNLAAARCLLERGRITANRSTGCRFVQHLGCFRFRRWRRLFLGGTVANEKDKPNNVFVSNTSKAIMHACMRLFVPGNRLLFGLLFLLHGFFGQILVDEAHSKESKKVAQEHAPYDQEFD